MHRLEDSTASEVDLCDEGSVADFMQVVREGKEPINCLDVSQVAGPAPTIIRYDWHVIKARKILTTSQQVV